MQTLNQLEQIIKESNSVNILKQVNINTGGGIHEHTHVLYDIRTLLGDTAKTYMEIGSYIGSSACLVQQNPFKSHIICVEPRKDYCDMLHVHLNKYNDHSHKYTIYNNLSTDKDMLDRLPNIKIDILFIDGDHTSEIVISDFKNYSGHVVSGGFIIFDDYLDHVYSPGVRGGVDYIVNNLLDNKFEVIGSIDNFRNAWTRYDLGGKMNGFILRAL